VTFELSRPLRSNRTGRDVGGLGHKRPTGPAREDDHRLASRYRPPERRRRPAEPKPEPERDYELEAEIRRHRREWSLIAAD
jgi:hypothetical protein